VCPTVPVYSRELRERAADELAGLAPESTLALLLLDYFRLRASARACQEASP
jgi:hypothetical protein